jgi:hypothetical protein
MGIALVMHAGARTDGAGRGAMNAVPASSGRIAKTCATSPSHVTGGGTAPRRPANACAMLHGRGNSVTYMEAVISAATRIRILRVRGRLAVVPDTVGLTEAANAQRHIRVNFAICVRREESGRTARLLARLRQVVLHVDGAHIRAERASARIPLQGPHAASARPEAFRKAAWRLAAGTRLVALMVDV